MSASFIRAHKSLHGLLSPGDKVCDKCRKVIPIRDSEAHSGTSGQATSKDKNPEEKETSTSTTSTTPSSEMEGTAVKQVATQELDTIMDMVGETPVRTGG